MAEEFVLINKADLASIADKVRSISGSTGTMNALDIDAKLDTEVGAVKQVLTTWLTDKGETVAEGTNLKDLASTVEAVNKVAQATPSVAVNSSGLITASATQSAGYVEAGTKSATKQLTTQAAKTVTPSTSSQTAVASGVYTTGAVTVAAIPSTYVKPSATKGATTYTPNTSNQTIAAGTYCSGAQTIKGDANLVASNIKKGTSIFGVSGSYEGTAGEDVTAETNEYTSLLTSLESAIDSLPDVGSGSDSLPDVGSGSGGGAPTTQTITINGCRFVDYVGVENGVLVLKTSTETNSSSSHTLEICTNTLFSCRTTQGATCQTGSSYVVSFPNTTVAVMKAESSCKTVTFTASGGSN